MPRRRRAGWIAVGVIAVIGLGLVLAGPPLIARMSSPSGERRAADDDDDGDGSDFDAPVPLTDRDRAPLRREARDGGGWIVHPTLGFELRDPGEVFVVADGPALHALEAAPEAARRFVHAYRFARDDGAALVVTLFGSRTTDAESFDEMVDGMVDGIRQQLGTVGEITREGQGLSSRADFRSTLGDVEMRTQVRFVGTHRASRATAVLLTINPADDPDLVSALESLRSRAPDR